MMLLCQSFLCKLKTYKNVKIVLRKEREMEKFDRITIDPKFFGGKPCIKELRFPVSKIMDLLAAGMSQEEILSDYPYLEREDIIQAIKYAAWILQEETVEVS
jgi:uncharacterized protein (DUF433 family)